MAVGRTSSLRPCQSCSFAIEAASRLLFSVCLPYSVSTSHWANWVQQLAYWLCHSASSLLPGLARLSAVRVDGMKAQMTKFGGIRSTLSTGT